MRTDTALHANYRWLARYNAWFNERLYDACEGLADAQRREHRGAFFGSVHGTLNHVLWGDRMWLGRLAAQPGAPEVPAEVLQLPAAAVYGTELYADWSQLRQARRALDASIEAFVAAFPPDFALSTMRYANTRGVQREHPMWQALTHFFNHQTHHRARSPRCWHKPASTRARRTSSRSSEPAPRVRPRSAPPPPSVPA